MKRTALRSDSIIAELNKHEIESQRKSIYEDLDALCDFGIEKMRFTRL